MIGETNCTSNGATCTKSTSNNNNNTQNNVNTTTRQQPPKVNNVDFMTQQQQVSQQRKEIISTDHVVTATSSAHRTTRPTTSPSQSSCLPCVQLLQDALLRSDSRPMQLLQRMMLEQQQEQLQQPRTKITSNNDTNSKSFPLSESDTSSAVRWKKASNGVLVEIPSSTAALLRSSSHGIRNNSIEDEVRTNNEQRQQHQLATSVKTKNKSVEKLTEWISLSCKICASTGPEANARAFVMGPTPLSIVVCQNRLVQTKPNTILSSSPQYYYATSSSLHPSPQQAEQIKQQQQPQSQQPQSKPYQANENGIRYNASNRTQFSVDSNYKKATATTTSAGGRIHFNEKQRNEIDEILTHELIHVYDIRQLQLDLRDCQNLAYSEVRAAREAECSKYYRNYDQLSTLTKHATSASSSSTTTAHTTNGSPEALTATSWSSMFFPSSADSSAAMANRCVRKKALLATNNLFPVTGKSCIESVFERAFNDHRPFNAMNTTTDMNKTIDPISTDTAASNTKTSNANCTKTNTNISTPISTKLETKATTSTTPGAAAEKTGTKDTLNLNRTLNRYFSIPLSSRTTKQTPTASNR